MSNYPYIALWVITLQVHLILISFVGIDTSICHYGVLWALQRWLFISKVLCALLRLALLIQFSDIARGPVVLI